MAKITKKDLSRGTRLSPEHIWDNNLDGVVDNITNVNPTATRAPDTDGLIQPQYETGNGTFRLTWTIPQLTSRWTFFNGNAAPYIIPFVVPPLQEFLTFNGISDHLTPQPVMTEFSYGFDTRDEPAMITDAWCGCGTLPQGGSATVPLANAEGLPYPVYVKTQSGPTIPATEDLAWQTNLNHGKLNYNFALRGDLKFSIWSKTSQHFNSRIPNGASVLTDLLYDIAIPMAAFLGPELRFNPNVEKDLNIPFDPNRTYALGIQPPHLHDPDDDPATSFEEHLALVNLTVSIKFKHRLVTRDGSRPLSATPNTRIVNQPSDHAGLKTPSTVTLTSPVAGTIIEADTPDGVNTTTTTLDDVFRKKLNAGYDVSSQSPQTEELCQDAGYDIIAIPMWNNQWNNMFTMRHGIYGRAPYHAPGMFTPNTGNGFRYMDFDDGPMQRAIIPIDYPFTIHHCFLAMNTFTANFHTNTLGALPYFYTWDQTTPTYFQHPKPAVNWLTDAGVADGGSDSRPIHDIGIGVGTGLRGAQYGYRQILRYPELDLHDLSVSDFCMDNIVQHYPTQDGYYNALPPHAEGTYPAWRMFNLPLNGRSAAGFGNGKGYFTPLGASTTPTTSQIAQDSPHFVGGSFITRDEDNQAVNPVTTASNEGTSVRFAGQTSADGEAIARDQWLEVRWKTVLQNAAGNPVGWNDVCENGSSSGGAAPQVNDDSKIIHGVGGHWIYLVIKKQTVSNANWQDTNLKGGM